MDVFALDDRLLAQYTGFARSFTRIRATEIQDKRCVRLPLSGVGSPPIARLAAPIPSTNVRLLHIQAWRRHIANRLDSWGTTYLSASPATNPRAA